MQTNNVLRAFCKLCNGIQIQIRCIAGQDRTGAGVIVNFIKHIFLHSHVFKHRLNHHIGALQQGPIGC